MFVQRFNICWQDQSENETALVTCYMNGRNLNALPTYPSYYRCNWGVDLPENEIEYFKFPSVPNTDHDDLAEFTGPNRDLGCIQIDIHRTVPDSQGRTEGATLSTALSVGQDTNQYPRNLSMQRRQDQWRDSQAPEYVVPTHIDAEPCAVFRFVFRPEEVLIPRGIMQEPPPLIRFGARRYVDPSVREGPGPLRTEARSWNLITEGSGLPARPVSPENGRANRSQESRSFVHRTTYSGSLSKR
ncbi:hypothetical protein NM688_g5907 [Phlebia brevispora]|uniref:Uncharacterized protein n=1 Tax=Phlebia brevispora TaxID=194682 RepID=A0ACC1SMT1_9APHY|nr:hypothetical protein NM688_g5907 [Phlebia brevispora]